MADTMKNISRAINVVVLIGIVIGGYLAYQYVQKGSSKASEIGRLQSLYSAGQYEEYLKEYDKLAAKYPEIKGQYGDQIAGCYAGMAQAKYEKAIGLAAAERAPAMSEICGLFEKAESSGKLDIEGLVIYCDALLDSGNFDKCAQVIKDAEARSDIDAGRLSAYKARAAKRK